jgi:hypothetical protein
MQADARNIAWLDAQAAARAIKVHRSHRGAAAWMVELDAKLYSQERARNAEVWECLVSDIEIYSLVGTAPLEVVVAPTQRAPSLGSQVRRDKVQQVDTERHRVVQAAKQQASEERARAIEQQRISAGEQDKKRVSATLHRLSLISPESSTLSPHSQPPNYKPHTPNPTP